MKGKNIILLFLCAVSLLATAQSTIGFSDWNVPKQQEAQLRAGWNNHLPDSIYTIEGMRIVGEAAITYDDEGRKILETGIWRDTDAMSEYSKTYTYSVHDTLLVNTEVSVEIVTDPLLVHDVAIKDSIIHIYRIGDERTPIGYYHYAINAFVEQWTLVQKTIAVEYDILMRPSVNIDSVFRYAGDTLVWREEIIYGGQGLVVQKKRTEAEAPDRVLVTEYSYNDKSELIRMRQYVCNVPDGGDCVPSYVEYEYGYDEKGNLASRSYQDYPPSAQYLPTYYRNVYLGASANEPVPAPCPVVKAFYANGAVHVTADTDTKFDVAVYNVQGQLVAAINGNTCQASISLADAPRGVYFVRVAVGNQVVTRKVLKD